MAWSKERDRLVAVGYDMKFGPAWAWALAFGCDCGGLLSYLTYGTSGMVEVPINTDIL